MYQGWREGSGWLVGGFDSKFLDEVPLTLLNLKANTMSGKLLGLSYQFNEFEPLP